jgi:hypothetical protein
MVIVGDLSKERGWAGKLVIFLAGFGSVWWYHATMTKNFTVRLPDDEASDIEALARAEGISLNETVRLALAEAVEKRRTDPEFKARVRRIIKEDRELLERLAR